MRASESETAAWNGLSTFSSVPFELLESRYSTPLHKPLHYTGVSCHRLENVRSARLVVCWVAARHAAHNVASFGCLICSAETIGRGGRGLETPRKSCALLLSQKPYLLRLPRLTIRLHSYVHFFLLFLDHSAALPHDGQHQGTLTRARRRSCLSCPSPLGLSIDNHPARLAAMAPAEGHRHASPEGYSLLQDSVCKQFADAKDHKTSSLWPAFDTPAHCIASTRASQVFLNIPSTSPSLLHCCNSKTQV